jgi:hypothetical protein
MEVSVKFSPRPLYLPEITSEPTKQEALLSGRFWSKEKSFVCDAI